MFIGTQQSEDPRAVWRGQQQNMIKQYLELAQNDLTVSNNQITLSHGKHLALYY